MMDRRDDLEPANNIPEVIRAARISRRLLLFPALALQFGWGRRSSLAQDATPVTATFNNPTPDPLARDYGPVAANEPYRVAALIPFAQDPFWIAVRSAIEAQAVENGIVVDVFDLENPDAPEENPSVPKQIGQIDSAIADGYQGILIGLVDAAAMSPGLVDANTRSVPVIALDVPPVGGEVISVIRTDNEAAGELAGEYVGFELTGKGTVLNIQGDLASSVAQDRDRGFKAGLEAYPEVKIKSVEADWDSFTSRRYVSVELPMSDDETPVPLKPLINAVFAADPNMALGAAEAVEDRKADSVFVVGFGLTVEVADAIRNGTVQATVAEMPERVGRIGVNLMVAHLNGDEAPAEVDSGFTMITRDVLPVVPPVESPTATVETNSAP